MFKKILDFWFSLSDKIRFLFVGGFNYVFAYFVFLIFLFFLGEENYQLNLILSWFFSSFMSFYTQRVFVFRSKKPIIKEYFKCFITWMLSYAVNAICLEICVRFLQIPVFIAQAFSAIVAAVSTYILFKTFAFKQK